MNESWSDPIISKNKILKQYRGYRTRKYHKFA